MAFSNLDVHKHRNKRLVIEPFDEKNLTPAGYDLSLGYAILLSSPDDGQLTEIDYKSYAPSAKDGSPPKEQPWIMVPGKSDVLVLTKERVHLSGKVLAQVHARSGIAAKGFILNPLTVDPNYGNAHGRLTLRLFNFSKDAAKLSINETIATLVLHSVESETLAAPLTYTQEISVNKYKHFTHVGPKVSDYLEHFGTSTDDEGERKFEEAVKKLDDFRRRLWFVRKFISLKDTWSWKGLLPFVPLLLVDIAMLLVRVFPALLSAAGVPPDLTFSPAFAVSMVAANFSYLALVRSMAK